MADTNGTNGHTSSPPGFLRTMAALASRIGLSARLGDLFHGNRQIEEVLGYKTQLTYQDFKYAFLRNDLAQRLVTIYPEGTWAQPPEIKETDEVDTQTPFEETWSVLQDRLQIFATLQRLDLLANLGRYAVLLIGLQGQTDLAQPAGPVRGPDDLLYLTPYSEEWATVHSIEDNPGLATFGKPRLYRINFDRTAGSPTQTPLSVGVRDVHASRVLHVAADELLDDDVYGVPWLAPLYNKLVDLLKVVGGGAEMFWRDAKRRIALEVQEGYALKEDAAAALTDEVEEYMHGLKDFLRLTGVTAKDLSGLVSSPKDHFEVLIDIICATRGIPKRVLMGSERGELASIMDQTAWNERVRSRQLHIAEPRYVRPLVTQLIALGALPAPAQPYTVGWADLLALSAKDRATVAKDVATALNQFAPGMAEQIVPAGEFRTEYLGLPAIPDVESIDVQPGDEEL